MSAHKLKVGDVCKLKEILPAISRCDDWKTGFYRVTSIRTMGYSPAYNNDPRFQSYGFVKVKKDGTVYKGFLNGYNCQAWDKFIEDGKVELVQTGEQQ